MYKPSNILLRLTTIYRSKTVDQLGEREGDSKTTLFLWKPEFHFQKLRIGKARPHTIREFIVEPVDHENVIALRYVKDAEEDGRYLVKRKLAPALFLYETYGAPGDLALRMWDAGFVLGLTILSWSTSDISPQCRAIELGSGCGTAGIAFAKRFPLAQVILTDKDEESRSLVMKNAEENLCSSNTHWKKLEWENIQDLEQLHGLRADVILAADCTYNWSSYKALLNVMDYLLKPEGMVLLAHKPRHSDENRFFEAARKHFKLARIETVCEVEISSLKRLSKHISQNPSSNLNAS
jgi:predicted nicotinamide N-methyase